MSSTEASGAPVRFGFEENLNVFSPKRLFAPTGGTIFDVVFFDPADQATPAATQGLGIVFTNVTEISTPGGGITTTDAMVSLFLQGQKIGEEGSALSYNVEASGSGGLSFLGVLLDAPTNVGATVQAGFVPFDAAKMGAGVVAMDDFVFGEPTVAPVPLPAGGWLLGWVLTGGATFGCRRRAA